MIHCAADLRIRQLGNFTSTILGKIRATLTSRSNRQSSNLSLAGQRWAERYSRTRHWLP